MLRAINLLQVLHQGRSTREFSCGRRRPGFWLVPVKVMMLVVESLCPDSIFFFVINPCCEWLQMETREREEQSKAACATNDGEKCTACMIVTDFSDTVAYQLFYLSANIHFMIYLTCGPI